MNNNNNNNNNNHNSNNNNIDNISSINDLILTSLSSELSSVKCGVSSHSGG